VHHDELLTVSAAAKVAERSEATIRRWLRAGVLPSTAGPVPAAGGHAPSLVRAGDLFAHLARSEQVPRLSSSVQADTGRVVRTNTSEHDDGAAGEVSALRAELERARMDGQLGTLRAELAAALARVELVEGERSRLAALLDEARRDRDDWRGRADALASELRAERERTGRPWWRRLLPGPVAVD
jgi:hypothetical protein